MKVVSRRELTPQPLSPEETVIRIVQNISQLFRLVTRLGPTKPENVSDKNTIKISSNCRSEGGYDISIVGNQPVKPGMAVVYINIHTPNIKQASLGESTVSFFVPINESATKKVLPSFLQTPPAAASSMPDCVNLISTIMSIWLPVVQMFEAQSAWVHTIKTNVTDNTNQYAMIVKSSKFLVLVEKRFDIRQNGINFLLQTGKEGVRERVACTVGGLQTNIQTYLTAWWGELYEAQHQRMVELVG